MRKVRIITDSCSDLGVELLEKYGIKYAVMSTVRDGEEKTARLDWSAQEAHNFYEIMRGGERIKTAQVSVEEFRRVFGEAAEAGEDAIYIGCSLKQSGSVNTGRLVAESIMSSAPHIKIICIDSQNASLGEGMLAVEAAKLALDGFSAEEIEKKIIALRKRVNQFVTVHSLDALRRAGRVKSTAAFFGNLMGVKPILISDADGEQTAIKKVKGRANSFSEIVSMLKEAIESPEEQTVYIAHADCDSEELEELVSLVKSEIGCREVYVGYIGPIIGASIGPDAVGIWGIGKEVTYRASEHV